MEVGRRERKKRLTRDRLEEAAQRLVAQRGYDSTTIDDIARAAGVSPRTFFRYFATKDEVVIGDQVEALDSLHSAMENALASDETGIADALVTFSGFLESDRDALLERCRLVVGNPSLRARALVLESAWAEAIACSLATHVGAVSPTFEQRVQAQCAVRVLSCALQEWHRHSAAESLPALTRRGFNLVWVRPTSDS